MKKFVWILGIIIAVGISAAFIYNQNKIILPKPVEKGFKNPLFYRPMYGYSRLWYSFICDTVITPYSIPISTASAVCYPWRPTTTSRSSADFICTTNA